MRMMKGLLSILFVSLLLVSCNHNSSNTNVTPTNAMPAAGTWKVSLFTDNGNEETSDFSAYTFQFQDNSVFAAIKNGQTVNGTWSKITDDGKQKLVITISSVSDNHLAELNEDWVINSMTSATILLVDDGNGSQHSLNFSKQQ